jgi:RNA polymerase sigma factor (sigma-70 family)
MVVDFSRKVASPLTGPNGYLRQRLVRQREQALVDEPAFQPDDPVEAAERAHLLRRALSGIGETDREILRLTLVEGEKPGAIAARLRMAPDVVRQRKSRAIKQVATAVARQSGTPRYVTACLAASL